jgi:hypothetical protein
MADAKVGGPPGKDKTAAFAVFTVDQARIP